VARNDVVVTTVQYIVLNNVHNNVHNVTVD